MLRVRNLKVSDIPALESIEAKTHSLFPSRTGWMQTFRSVIERSLAEEPEGILVAELDGVVVGLAIVRQRGNHPLSGEKYGLMIGLTVSPDHRRQGIGKRLLKEAETYCKVNDCQAMHLWLPSDATQEEALVFTKNGYSVVSWELKRSLKKSKRA